MNTISKLRTLPILGLLAASLIATPTMAQAGDRYDKSEWRDYVQNQNRQHKFEDRGRHGEYKKHGLKHRAVNEQRREYRKELRRENRREMRREHRRAERKAERRAERRADRRQHRMQHRYERQNQRHYVINHNRHHYVQPHHKHHDGRKLIKGIIGLSILGHMLNH